MDLSIAQDIFDHDSGEDLISFPDGSGSDFLMPLRSSDDQTEYDTYEEPQPCVAQGGPWYDYTRNIEAYHQSEIIPSAHEELLGHTRHVVERDLKSYFGAIKYICPRCTLEFIIDIIHPRRRSEFPYKIDRKESRHRFGEWPPNIRWECPHKLGIDGGPFNSLNDSLKLIIPALVAALVRYFALPVTATSHWMDFKRSSNRPDIWAEILARTAKYVETIYDRTLQGYPEEAPRIHAEFQVMQEIFRVAGELEAVVQSGRQFRTFGGQVPLECASAVRMRCTREKRPKPKIEPTAVRSRRHTHNRQQAPSNFRQAGILTDAPMTIATHLAQARLRRNRPSTRSHAPQSMDNRLDVEHSDATPGNGLASLRGLQFTANREPAAYISGDSHTTLTWRTDLHEQTNPALEVLMVGPSQQSPRPATTDQLVSPPQMLSEHFVEMEQPEGEVFTSEYISYINDWNDGLNSNM